MQLNLRTNKSASNERHWRSWSNSLYESSEFYWTLNQVLKICMQGVKFMSKWRGAASGTMQCQFPYWFLPCLSHRDSPLQLSIKPSSNMHLARMPVNWGGGLHVRKQPIFQCNLTEAEYFRSVCECAHSHVPDINIQRKCNLHFTFGKCFSSIFF